MNNPWITIYAQGSAPSKLRLFCFPFAGGGSAFYRTWPNGLPDGVEICAVRPPGRESRLREQPYARLESLVAAAAEALEPLLALPFAFFGHSMGGLLAYELARHFRAGAMPMPTHLFVSGYRAPHRPAHHSPIHRADTPTVLARLRNLNGTPAAFFENQELVDMMLPGIRADFSVLETYVFEADEPLDCPISVFGGYYDNEATEADVAAWRGYTNNTFTLRMIPGGHFFINSHQPQILQAIADDLAFYLTAPIR
jgi:medium-chain acyl-[acyl-carrier-protein] hydrolase